MSDKDIYREFCRTENDLPIFMKDWYLDGVCNGETWDVVCVNRKNKPVAFLPYILKTKYSFTYITFPSFAKFMGPYIVPEFRELKVEHEIQKELIEKLPKIAGYKQNFSPEITNWLPFFWKGYNQTTKYTYRIDNLANLDEVYNSFNRNVKRNIKKAELHLELKEELSLAEFYEMNCKSFDRQGIQIPYSFDVLKKHDESLVKNNSRKILYLTDKNGRIYSVAYLIWDNKRVYYHFSGDDPEFRDSGAGIYLIWKSIEYTSKVLNLDMFDFEGSVMQNIERIRVQFGAKQVPYFYVSKYNSKIFWLLESIQNIIGR